MSAGIRAGRLAFKYVLVTGMAAEEFDSVCNRKKHG
jgi:hypothetical protein